MINIRDIAVSTLNSAEVDVLPNTTPALQVPTAGSIIYSTINKNLYYGDGLVWRQSMGSNTILGGDLGGFFPNPTVIGIRGVPVSATPPTAGQILVLVGGIWTPQTPSGTLVVTMTGDVTGQSNANTVTKIQGVNVSAVAPTPGQVLSDVGGVWTPVSAGIYRGSSFADVGILFPSTAFHAGVGGAQCTTDTKGITWCATVFTLGGHSMVEMEISGTVNGLSGSGATFLINFPMVPAGWPQGTLNVPVATVIATQYAYAYAQNIGPTFFTGTCPLVVTYSANNVTLDGQIAALATFIQTPPAGVAGAGGYTFTFKCNYVV